MEAIKQKKNTLLFDYPAAWWHDMWREGLVSGNGIIGANVYGGTKVETVMLSHTGLWHGGFEDKLPNVSKAFYEMRKKMDEGNYKEASWEIVNELKKTGYKTQLESPFPLADFQIHVQPQKGFSEYLRALNMETGEVSSQWIDDGTFFKRDLFVSRADGMIVWRIEADHQEINATFSLDMHINSGSKQKDICRHIVESKETSIEGAYITYTAKNDDGTDYGVVIRICQKGGALEEKYGKIKVNKTNSITAYMKLFIKGDKDIEVARIKQELSQINRDYDFYLKRHIELHKSLFHRASIDLGGTKNRSNEELLRAAFKREQPLELIEKMWKFGRYLFISGTAPDSYPFALYGLWGGEYQLIWPHNMANENIQMIYWHCMVGNLIEFHKSFFQYYNDRLEIYKDNAKNLFNCRGIYMTAGTTPNVSTPNQVVPVIMNWVGAAGWIAQHYYMYYSYTKDKKYFKQTILPFMDEVAKFYEDYITFYEDGSIKFYPSVSPENTPQNFMPPENIQMAHPMPTTINATIDLAIVKEFFTSMLTIAREEDLFEDRVAQWHKILESIPPYKCNELGAIKEWQEDMFEDRYDHRHLSHIYPVFPGYEKNTVDNKEEMIAFEKAVDLRKIDAQTGWSMAHMAAIYARFDNGEAALTSLDNMAKSCMLPNLFTVHNDWRNMSISLSMEPAPIQLDAALGYVNAVQEMLLYSSCSLVKLLPALPSRFKTGKVSGFQFIGGSVNMKWDRERAFFYATLKAKEHCQIKIKLPNFCSDYKMNGVKAEIKERGKDWILVHFYSSGELIISSSSL